MNFYELSLRTLVPEDEVRRFLGAQLGVDPRQIGTQLEYVERINTASPLRAGFTVRTADGGDRTYVAWVQDVELSPGAYLTLAAEAARALATQGAIPHGIEPTDAALGDHPIVLPARRLG